MLTADHSHVRTHAWRTINQLDQMMEAGYRPTGWLGLIMGTRVYFNFHPAAVDTEAAFSQQMDAVVRELGPRGQPSAPRSRVSEGVPAQVTPPRSAAFAPIAAADQPFSPSMQMVATHSSSSVVSSAAMVERLLDEAKADRAEAKADRAAMEARLEAKDATLGAKDAIIAELMARPAPATATVSEEQLATLQARFEGLHAANLFTDEVSSHFSSCVAGTQ